MRFMPIQSTIERGREAMHNVSGQFAAETTEGGRMKRVMVLINKWRKKRRTRKVCKAFGYNCSECIYHEHIFEGIIFRGTKCRLEDA